MEYACRNLGQRRAYDRPCLSRGDFVLFKIIPIVRRARAPVTRIIRHGSSCVTCSITNYKQRIPSYFYSMSYKLSQSLVIIIIRLSLNFFIGLRSAHVCGKLSDQTKNYFNSEFHCRLCNVTEIHASDY